MKARKQNRRISVVALCTVFMLIALGCAGRCAQLAKRLDKERQLHMRDKCPFADFGDADTRPDLYGLAAASARPGTTGDAR
jgi:hypothetical protein